MNRGALVTYLEGCGCYPDGKEDAGEWWVNCVNFEETLIPWDEELSITTSCHTIYELRVPPIPEFDSDYEVYKLWREHDMMQPIPTFAPNQSGPEAKN